jgi:sec-independent protein translocase protein TatC
VAPGLYKHEKKLAIPLLISSVLLFYLGAAFAYYVVFPVMLSFFVATTPHGVQMMTDMGSYLDFVMILLLAFGLAFEVPVATVLLVWTGFVRIATLKKNRGFVLLGIFIFAAFVTPPDAVSQSAMAVPMYLLYEIGIIMAGLLLKDKIAARAKEERCSSRRCGSDSPTTACAPCWCCSWSLRSPPAASASTTGRPRRSTDCTPRGRISRRCPAAGSRIG